MGLYNIVSTEMTCPMCAGETTMEIEVKSGNVYQHHYVIGDIYKWHEGLTESQGGRPPHGACNIEGYSECPLCKKDFFVRVVIDQDVIKSVCVNRDKKGFIE